MTAAAGERAGKPVGVCGEAAAISGAGPSVLALVPAERVDEARAHGPRGWRVLTPGIPDAGVRVTVKTRPTD